MSDLAFHHELVDDLAQLEKRRRELVKENQSLEMQLAGADPRGYRHGPDYMKWRRATIQTKMGKQRELSVIKEQIRDLRRRVDEGQPRFQGNRVAAMDRSIRVERKLDLLLAALGVPVPDELAAAADDEPVASEDDDDIARDLHGTPWEDAIKHRLPGSYETGKRR